MWSIIPFAAYTIGNGGVFKHNSENSTTADKLEVDYLGRARSVSIAQYYTDRFITYMSYNQATFPEYYLNSNADVYPDTDANFSSWVL
jgi:protein involved in sex pheromone biosynthesis